MPPVRSRNGYPVVRAWARRAGRGPARRRPARQVTSSPATSTRVARRSPRPAFIPSTPADGRPRPPALRAIRDRLRAGVRPAGAAPAPRARRRAGAHRALAEHERPQPRRGLRPAARALRLAGTRCATRPSTRSRTRSGPAASRRRRRCGSSRSSRALDDDDLRWLEDAPLEEARDYLCALPGVGRKTAACVLLFSYGRPDVPVDTHVYRVGTRLGLFRPGAPLEEAHDEMLRLARRPEDAYELHVLLIRHGRRTCTARAPRCAECPLLACARGARAARAA